MTKRPNLRDPRTLYPAPPFPEQKQPPPGIVSEIEPPADHGETSYRGSVFTRSEHQPCELNRVLRRVQNQPLFRAIVRHDDRATLFTVARGTSISATTRAFTSFGPLRFRRPRPPAVRTSSILSMENLRLDSHAPPMR